MTTTERASSGPAENRDLADPQFIVGIGASAGGLEALEDLFLDMPSNTGCAFVVIQHLSPDFESMMDDILARRTQMEIRHADNGTRLRRDTIFLIQPGTELTIQDRQLRVTNRPAGVLTFPIDVFFRSLAKDLGPGAIAIVLSGTGTDGSRGIRDIRAAGGLVMIQDQVSAKFSGMPISAAASGQAQEILPPADMPEALMAHVRVPTESDGLSSNHRRLYERLGKLLFEQHSLDLEQYKPMTVLRRIERRMSGQGYASLEDYLDVLQANPDELAQLHRDLLIGVTQFFRDPEAFDALRQTLADVFRNAGPKGPRVWVPGCATGQEAYTIAALLNEYAVSEDIDPEKIKIFATDVNRESIAIASAGIYDADLVATTPPVLRKHFEQVEGLFRVAPDLRRLVVFAPHNILHDPPFTRIDLISCRNVLIYLTPTAQQRAITLFHFALNKGGVLFLGPSESLGDVEEEFEPLNYRQKLFRKRRDVRLREGLQMTRTTESLPRQKSQEGPMVHAAFHTLLQRYVPPTLLINEENQVVHTFGDAAKYLIVGPGRTSLSVSAMVHADLRAPMMAAINRIRRTQKATSYPAVPLAGPDGEEYSIRLVAELMRDRRMGTNLYVVTLETDTGDEIAPAPSASSKAEQSALAQIRDLQEELRATEERLETTIEELETSNEELQATNEEQLSSNEEMQSTNEELQSVNEELYTVNAEHQRKIAELVELTQDLDNLLKGTAIETLFLDAELRIRRYTPSLAQSFSLLPADVGRPIEHLASNLRHPGIIEDIRSVLNTQKPVDREVQNVRGTWLDMNVRPYSTADNHVDGVVVTFTDVSARKAREARLERELRGYRSALDVADQVLILFDSSGRLIYSNTAADRTWRDPNASTALDFSPGGALHERLESALRSGQPVMGSVRIDSSPEGCTVRYELVPITDASDAVSSVVCAMQVGDLPPRNEQETQERPNSQESQEAS